MGRKSWLVVAVLILLILLVAAAAPLLVSPRDGSRWGMMGRWTSGGWGMMGMMFLWPVLLLVLAGVCVAGIVWAVQAGSRSRGQSDAGTGKNETPFDILKRRYASGEITQQEFDEMGQKLAT